MSSDNNNIDQPLRVFQHLITSEHLHRWFKRFHDNLNFIETWKQHEILELIILGVDLSNITHEQLIKFRDRLDDPNHPSP